MDYYNGLLKGFTAMEQINGAQIWNKKPEGRSTSKVSALQRSQTDSSVRNNVTKYWIN